MTAMTILSEAGWDMSKWATEDHFVSWLRLCPDNRISGEKIIGKRRLPTNNRITIALKMAASSLRKNKTYLGAQFRRLRTKLGAPIAIKAMAAKLAPLVYRMLRYGMKYYATLPHVSNDVSCFADMCLGLRSSLTVSPQAITERPSAKILKPST